MGNLDGGGANRSSVRPIAAAFAAKRWTERPDRSMIETVKLEAELPD
ncbi:hypothetical protein [Psychromicrobium lacuslunae]|nr:hypothetical protein [Psychromicrobium lacuslunae]